MPNNFTENMEWMDCKVTLINFLKYQPGNNGVPLSYVIREIVATIVQTTMNFLDDYVDRTPLTGKVLNADASRVNLYIARLISENEVAKKKLLPHKDALDGHSDYLVLQ